MSVHFIDGGQTLLVGGPAKVIMVADDPPLPATRPTPTLGSISPTTSVAGAATPDFTLTCTGTNFSQFSKIMIGDVDVPTTYVSATSLTCRIDPGSFVAGAQQVRVRNGTLVTAPQTLTFT